MRSVKRERSQIYHRNVFRPADPHQLTWKQKKEALESHMFLEEKRNLDIKGRIVAGGNKQREYMDKREASSPTSHTEAVFITAAVEAAEGWKPYRKMMKLKRLLMKILKVKMPQP